MPLAFVDAHGADGTISDDLVVSHSGAAAITESIENHLQQLNGEAGTSGDVLESLIVELPHECDVREIRRTDLD